MSPFRTDMIPSFASSPHQFRGPRIRVDPIPLGHFERARNLVLFALHSEPHGLRHYRDSVPIDRPVIDGAVEHREPA
ncbi:hypothetical protein SBA2_360046 [Acidobacteriia bacterium SbA2]|nr:hypothetical protein SBA2_360046 [Acidobacteriia bacterium SbA2]